MKITVRKGNVETALRLFRKKIVENNVLFDYKEKQYHEKKTTKRAREEKEKEPKTKKAKGSLFKKSTPNVPIEEGEVEVTKSKFVEGSDEYWNEQRQNLGMSKLK